MGTAEFARKVFDKVFKEDISRLRSMEDMWKIRKPPIAFSFDDIVNKSQGIKSSIAREDQKVWSEAENFAVFCDRYD